MNKIYIGNLPFKTNDADLTEIFAQFGEIKEIALIKDRYSNEFKGFGFITYANQTSAESALSMNGKDFGGRPMKVNMAREEDRSGGRRPGGAGRSGSHHGGRQENRW